MFRRTKNTLSVDANEPKSSKETSIKLELSKVISDYIAERILWLLSNLGRSERKSIQNDPHFVGAVNDISAELCNKLSLTDAMGLATLRRRPTLLALEIPFKAFLVNHSDSRLILLTHCENKIP